MRLRDRTTEVVLGAISAFIMVLLLGWPLMTFVRWLNS